VKRGRLAELRGGLTRRVGVASGLLVLIVAAAFAVLLFEIEDMRAAGRQLLHSRAELTAASRLEKLVIDMETGQRGFVITREERFLAPWEVARRRLPQEARRLLRLTDDPRENARARGIVRAIESYVRDYSIPLVGEARRGDPAPRGLAATAAGKRRVDTIRHRFDRFVAAERRIATERQHDADADARRAVIAAGAGLVGSIILILLFAGYLTRAIVLPVRRAAAMAGRLARGDLSVRMTQTAPAEIGDLERAFNTMGSSLEASQAELRRIAEEQAALRRVATLVARGGPPGEVLDAVTREIGEVLDANGTRLLRYDPDGTASGLASWSRDGTHLFPLNERFPLEDDNLVGRVLRTGRPARIQSYEELPESIAARLRRAGIGSTAAAPIVVEGRLWGVMVGGWKQDQPVPPDVEGRMAQFTELVAMGIANANSRAELAASRARVVAAADETRRRIERDLHDGTQQRLVSLGLELRAAEAMVPREQTELRTQLSNTAKGLAGALEDLQDISRGIHPAILSRGGLGPALKTLARRSPVPVELEVRLDGRLPPSLEAAAYYVVSEALTNAAKHARASEVQVEARASEEWIELSVQDDGVGGADPGQGSGLIGLKDRVEALGGELTVASPAGGGTSLRARMPIPPEE
jgi:signal transduction histidine kinase